MKTYWRSGKKAVFCRCRKVLLLDTPEERVRQKVITYLIDVIGVPEENIKSEMPLCHLKRGAKGRADIVVFNVDNKPLLVVETKASGFSNGAPIEQAERYARIIEAKFIAVACSEDIEDIFYYEVTPNNCIQLSKTPTYRSLTGRKKINYHNKTISQYISEIKLRDPDFRQQGIIGQDTPSIIAPHLFRLWKFLLTEKPIKLPIRKHDITLFEDKGLNYRSYGNAAGGSYCGWYRGFLLKDKKTGDHQLISIGIFGTGKCENHPIFGNRKGITCLNIAIHDFDNNPHNSLQCRLDDFVELIDDYLVIRHNGSMTSGKTGAVKRSLVIDYVKEYAPFLIKDNLIYLGKIPIKNPTWSEGQDFVTRIIRYALLRDQLRKELRRF